MTLALFDFDGTITRRDSLFDFVRFYHGDARFFRGMLRLLPMLVWFKLGQMPNWQAKEQLLTRFFGGEPVDTFRQKAQTYAQQRLPQIVKDSALRKIEEFQRQSADVYVVSASAEDWLRPWCDNIGVKLIATRLAVQDGRLSGRIAGYNCHGPEKVRRVQAVIELDRYDKIYGYGDSNGDRELLALTHYPHYRFFR